MLLSKAKYILIILFMVVFSSSSGDGSEGHHSLKEEYDYYELTLPPDWLRALPLSINKDGVVVGMGYHSNRDIGFSHSNGYYSEFLPPGWSWASAEDINDYGTVVGMGSSTGFLYLDGNYSEVIPPGGVISVAKAVNNKGEFVGYGSAGQGPQGFLLSAGEYTVFLI